MSEWNSVWRSNVDKSIVEGLAVRKQAENIRRSSYIDPLQASGVSLCFTVRINSKYSVRSGLWGVRTFTENGPPTDSYN